MAVGQNPLTQAAFRELGRNHFLDTNIRAGNIHADETHVRIEIWLSASIGNRLFSGVVTKRRSLSLKRGHAP
jgi:hypothetical protein